MKFVWKWNIWHRLKWNKSEMCKWSVSPTNTCWSLSSNFPCNEECEIPNIWNLLSCFLEDARYPVSMYLWGKQTICTFQTYFTLILDSKIISLIDGKLVPVPFHARTMEKTKNFSIIYQWFVDIKTLYRIRG
jgi:hypothetical protein